MGGEGDLEVGVVGQKMQSISWKWHGRWRRFGGNGGGIGNASIS